MVDETEVAIVGAGPAGLLLSHLLTARGIDCIVLEQRDRHYVEHRVRAGVLEHPTVELLRSLGLAERLDREGLTHRGVQLAFEGRRHHIDFLDLTGCSITVYGQQEVVKDLIAARLAAGGQTVFEALDVAATDVDTDHPVVRYRHGDEDHVLRCRIVAGCDGFHGGSRALVPDLTVAEREHAFAWLGILAQAAPTQDELIYANHERGFALYSMRSPTVTRLYLQVPADERIEAWSDDRIWSELHTRLPTADGFTLEVGPILDRGITPMRSFVATPMRHGNLLLAGDAAHIVPPTGAKGMNLAIADVAVMAGLLDDALRGGRPDRLDGYTATCLRRVWRAQHFSSWMTAMLHRLGDDPFQHQLQLAELALVTGTEAAATSLALQYVGFPFDTVAA
ncbi:MAG: 4-hydroxybenzoate 3-monooxygenase [Ilumatobacteraceae bacterium]